MKTYINKAALNRTSFNSQAVSMLSYIVHPVKEVGSYIGKVYEGKVEVDEFMLQCTEEAKNHQVDIDLGAFDQIDLNKRGEHKYVIKKDGFIVLYNSKNDKNYRIKLERLAKTKGSRVSFDTYKLSQGDHYATTLLRPGRYEARVNKERTKLLVDVMYPKTRSLSERQKVLEPIQVKVTEKGFSTKKVKLTPGQGLVFPFEKAGAVQIKLVKAYEEKPVTQPVSIASLKKKRKTKKVLKKYHWENPIYKT